MSFYRTVKRPLHRFADNKPAPYTKISFTGNLLKDLASLACSSSEVSYRSKPENEAEYFMENCTQSLVSEKSFVSTVPTPEEGLYHLLGSS